MVLLGTGCWDKNFPHNVDGQGSLAGFCEADAQVRATYSVPYRDATAYSDPADSFNDDSIDAVMIATPAVSHRGLAHQALEAGKYDFVERPLCLDVSWLHPYKDYKTMVVGSEGMVVFNDVEQGNDDLLVWPHHITTGAERTVPPFVDRAQAKPIPSDQNLEPMRNECAFFIHAVETRERPSSDGEKATLVLTILAAAQTSMDRSGSAITSYGPTLRILLAKSDDSTKPKDML